MDPPEYNSAYVDGKARVVDVYADHIVRNMTFEVLGILNATLQLIGALGDEVVECTSLRRDEDGRCACFGRRVQAAARRPAKRGS